MRRLDTLAADLRGRGVQLIVYLAPVHPDYRADIESAGLAPLYGRWRTELGRLATRHRAALVESDTPAFLDSIETPCPAGSPRAHCLFYDPLHFRPVVGRAILAEGLRPTAPDAPRSRTAPPDR